MLRKIGKQHGESAKSVLEKKRKATDLQKRKVLSWNERVRGDGILIIITIKMS